MESTLVWIMIFAGAAIGLLGLFLFSSEKELKLKRREIEVLSAKLNAAPGIELGDSTADQQHVLTDLSAELTARNKELSERITALAIQLQESHDKIADLQSAGLRPSDMETEMAQLRSSHQRLQDENSQLKNQLLDSEESFQKSAGASLETAERYFKMEAQVRELSQELEESQARVRELEASKEQFANIDFNHSALQERQSLETRISELENELAVEKQKLVDFEVTQSRLCDLEQRCFDMDEDNRRLREEIARGQEDVAESGENRRRLALVRERLEELELLQASLAQQHGNIRDEMVALAAFIGAAPETPLQLELSDDPFRNAGDPAELTAEYGAPSSTEDRGHAMSHDRGRLNEPAENVNDQSSLRQHSQLPNKPAHAGTQSNGKQGYNYKLLVAMIPVLLIAGTVVAGFLRKNPTAPEGPVASTISTSESIPRRLAEPKADAQKPLAVANQSRSKDAPPASAEKRREAQVPETASFGKEAQVRTISVASSAPNPRVDEGVTAKSKAAPSKPPQVDAQPSPRVWGGYELVRPAAVYSEPTENSQPIAKLDSGTQVNVVSARDGWLEIRSKNGRPPGFIRSDTAVRMRQN